MHGVEGFGLGEQSGNSDLRVPESPGSLFNAHDNTHYGKATNEKYCCLLLIMCEHEGKAGIY